VRHAAVLHRSVADLVVADLADLVVAEHGMDGLADTPMDGADTQVVGNLSVGNPMDEVDSHEVAGNPTSVDGPDSGLPPAVH